MTSILFDPIKTMGKMTGRVIVLYSGGKDSAVTLDLCSRYFKELYIAFMFIVPALSFSTALFRWVKNRYQLSVNPFPHFILSTILRYGSFRLYDLSVPIVTVEEIYNYIRERSGIWWIAGGERIKDSIWRNAILKKNGSIDKKRGRFYPVAYWSKKEILEYIKFKKLKISPESHVLGYSFRSLMPRDLEGIKKYYPEDYQKIQSWFPLVEASRIQGYLSGMIDENTIPKV